MHFINKIFPNAHHKSSFQIEDVSGSEEEENNEEIPKIHISQHFGQLRKKPLAKMGQADFLSRYDANFDDVFGENPNPLEVSKQDEQIEISNPKKQTKKRVKTPKDPKTIKEPNEIKEPKISLPKEPKPPRIKLPRQRKRTPNNHILKSEESVHSQRESAQKFNPNQVALPQTKSEKKADKQKSVNTKKQNEPSRERKQRPRKIEKSPSPNKRVQTQRPKRKTLDPLEILNVDELTLNPNIAPCTPNLYLDYKPVYD